MGKLSNRKRAASFETDAAVFSKGSRNVIIELAPHCLSCRLKGTRTRYTIGYDQIWWAALKLAQSRASAERRAERQARKGITQ